MSNSTSALDFLQNFEVHNLSQKEKAEALAKIKSMLDSEPYSTSPPQKPKENLAIPEKFGGRKLFPKKNTGYPLWHDKRRATSAYNGYLHQNRNEDKETLLERRPYMKKCYRDRLRRGAKLKREPENETYHSDSESGGVPLAYKRTSKIRTGYQLSHYRRSFLSDGKLDMNSQITSGAPRDRSVKFDYRSKVPLDGRECLSDSESCFPEKSSKPVVVRKGGIKKRFEELEISEAIKMGEKPKAKAMTQEEIDELNILNMVDLSDIGKSVSSYRTQVSAGLSEVSSKEEYYKMMLSANMRISQSLENIEKRLGDRNKMEYLKLMGVSKKKIIQKISRDASKKDNAQRGIFYKGKEYATLDALKSALDQAEEHNYTVIQREKLLEKCVIPKVFHSCAGLKADLAEIEGTGANGRILKRDIQKYFRGLRKWGGEAGCSGKVTVRNKGSSRVMMERETIRPCKGKVVGMGAHSMPYCRKHLDQNPESSLEYFEKVLDSNQKTIKEFIKNCTKNRHYQISFTRVLLSYRFDDPLLVEFYTRLVHRFNTEADIKRKTRENLIKKKVMQFPDPMSTLVYSKIYPITYTYFVFAYHYDPRINEEETRYHDDFTQQSLGYSVLNRTGPPDILEKHKYTEFYNMVPNWFCDMTDYVKYEMESKAGFPNFDKSILKIITKFIKNVRNYIETPWNNTKLEILKNRPNKTAYYEILKVMEEHILKFKECFENREDGVANIRKLQEISQEMVTNLAKKAQEVVMPNADHLMSLMEEYPECRKDIENYAQIYQFGVDFSVPEEDIDYQGIVENPIHFAVGLRKQHNREEILKKNIEKYKSLYPDVQENEEIPEGKCVLSEEDEVAAREFVKQHWKEKDYNKIMDDQRRALKIEHVRDDFDCVLCEVENEEYGKILCRNCEENFQESYKVEPVYDDETEKWNLPEKKCEMPPPVEELESEFTQEIEVQEEIQEKNAEIISQDVLESEAPKEKIEENPKELEIMESVPRVPRKDLVYEYTGQYDGPYRGAMGPKWFPEVNQDKESEEWLEFSEDMLDCSPFSCKIGKLYEGCKCYTCINIGYPHARAAWQKKKAQRVFRKFMDEHKLSEYTTPDDKDEDPRIMAQFIPIYEEYHAAKKILDVMECKLNDKVYFNNDKNQFYTVNRNIMVRMYKYSCGKLSFPDKPCPNCKRCKLAKEYGDHKCKLNDLKKELEGVHFFLHSEKTASTEKRAEARAEIERLEGECEKQLQKLTEFEEENAEKLKTYLMEHKKRLRLL